MPTDDSSLPHRYDGLATAAAFILWGALCVPASTYFDAHGSLHTAWTVAGVVLAFIGVLGAVTEATSLSPREALSDFGFAFLFLVFAGGTHLLSTADWLRSPFVGALRVLVAFFVVFAVYGLSRGIGRAAETSHKRREAITAGVSEPGPTRMVKIQALIVGLLGTATAIANFLATVHSKK